MKTWWYVAVVRPDGATTRWGPYRYRVNAVAFAVGDARILAERIYLKKIHAGAYEYVSGRTLAQEARYYVFTRKGAVHIDALGPHLKQEPLPFNVYPGHVIETPAPQP